MKIAITQCYIEAGVDYPFSHHFQRYLSNKLEEFTEPSQDFIKKFGHKYKVIIYISAKREIVNNDIRGPRVYKNHKDVEYTVFLPFDFIASEGFLLQRALEFIKEGICVVLKNLHIDISNLENNWSKMKDHILSSVEMVENTSTD